MKYELLEHTADAKFRAYGKTLDEVFANSVEALAAIVIDPKEIGKEKKKEIKVKAKDLKKLLFNLLDELLFLLDTEKFLAAEANMHIVERNGEYFLDATLHGDDARKWPHNLKAVTYSEMLAHQEKEYWVLQAVIDI